MAKQGASGTEDQMPAKDNFFATLDNDDEAQVSQARTIEENVTQTPKMGADFVQEADRLENKAEVKPSDADDAKDKSDNSELLEAMKTQTQNINALINSQQTPSTQQAQPEKEQPKNLAEYLFGKDGAEEFVYDPEEAVSDPSSDSAKYHRAEIALETSKQIARSKAEADEQDAQTVFKNEKAALMSEFKMSEADFSEFEKTAGKRNVSLKDIYLMIHRDEIAKNIAKNTVDQFSNQRTKMSQMAPAFAAKGGKEIQPQTDSQFFSGLFGIKDNEFETTI